MINLIKHIAAGIVFVALALVVIVGLYALSGAIIMFLWNWVIVTLFHVQPITWLLGIGVSLVLSVLGSVFGVVVRHNG